MMYGKLYRVTASRNFDSSLPWPLVSDSAQYHNRPGFRLRMQRYVEKQHVFQNPKIIFQLFLKC
jgi:hypothetical protein